MLFSLSIAVAVMVSAPAQGVPTPTPEPEPEPEAATQVALPFPITVVGNRVLPEAVYTAVLRLPADAKPTHEMADTVAKDLRAFLFRAGYRMAEVKVVRRDEGLEVIVDEGQLQRVLFKGALTLARIRVALSLNIPYGVFNQADFEKQVDALSEQLDLPILWQLVPARDVRHSDFQLKETPVIRGISLIPPDERYELHINVGEPEWPVGLGADLRTSWLDGLELGIHYRGSNLLFRGSRWKVAASGGIGMRGEIFTPSFTPAFSRGTLEATWFGPPLFTVLRPVLAAKGEQVSRRRTDLAIDSYQYTGAEVTLAAQLELDSRISFALYGGAYMRGLYALSGPGAATPPPTEAGVVRPLVGGSATILLSSPDARSDWRHEISASTRFNLDIGTYPAWGETKLKYMKAFLFGWHELRLRANGVLLWGAVLFHNEQPLADPHLRGVFGDIWVRRAASAQIEFRFSLVRDVFQVGFFADGAAYGTVPVAPATAIEPRFGISFGPTVNFLAEGTFQFDAFLAVGMLSDGRVRVGPLLLINKVL
jgi:hypothetical protein